MTVDSRRARGDLEHGPAEVLTSFADVSLGFALAQTESEFRNALESATSHLAHIAAGPVAIGELGLSASGKARLLWCSRSGGLAIDDGDLFEDWYARTSRRDSELLPAKPGSWQGLLSDDAFSGDTGLRAAVFLHNGNVSAECVAQGHAIANAAAVANIRIRGSLAVALERRRFESLFGATQSWLELDADILWEAREDGVVRVRRTMNGRKDIAALVDGIGIASIRTADDGQSLLDVLRERRSIRRLRVELDCSLGGGGLYVSAGTREDDQDSSYFLGVLAEGDSDDARHRSRETASMMIQMRGARLREERQRREAEAMLQGLRLLLAQDSTREKMEQLVSLVCECIGASGACVVQRGLDGNVRLLIPRQGAPGGDADAALDLVASGERGGATAYDAETATGRLLGNAFYLDGRHFAALPLPMRGVDAFLICATSRAEGFLPEDIDFADRLTLLLRQALLLREEQGQLAQTAKMAALGQMSASIAHELRQPLNTISLAVQNLEILLEAPEVDSAAIASKTKRVLAQVERASEVIDRMRRFGRKSAGEQTTVLLRDLVENVETIMHHVLLRAGIRLESDVPENLAAVGDQLQLEQVLGNLIQNAVDAISGIGAKHERDEGLIRIRATPSSGEKDMVSLRVEDSGPGFRREILSRALEPFFTTKSAEHGTGLGLAICDTIIRESGGRIELGNHDGGGCVALVLPRAAG